MKPELRKYIMACHEKYQKRLQEEANKKKKYNICPKMFKI